MTPADPTATRASVEVARVALGRMMGSVAAPGVGRSTTVTMAARAGDAWKAGEDVLRAITGNSELAGQSLLTEARRLDKIDMEGMHALVALREWVERTLTPGSAAQMLTLAPTETEKSVARNALSALERAAGVEQSAGTGAPAGPNATPADMEFAPRVGSTEVPAQPPTSSRSQWAPQPVSGTPASAERSARSPVAPAAAAFPPTGTGSDAFEPGGPGYSSPGTGSGRASSGLIMAGVVAVLLLVAAGGWYLLRGGAAASSSTDEGIAAYSRGARESARTALAKAVTENPNDVRALIYLGRIGREQGDLATSQRYLEMAIRVEPQNALALRELGSALLADKQPELARRFYVRALGVDPDDRIAQGFLGCALMRLNRTEEAARWFSRAGPGDWSSCNVVPGTGPARD